MVFREGEDPLQGPSQQLDLLCMAWMWALLGANSWLGKVTQNLPIHLEILVSPLP